MSASDAFVGMQSRIRGLKFESRSYSRQEPARIFRNGVQEGSEILDSFEAVEVDARKRYAELLQVRAEVQTALSQGVLSEGEREILAHDISEDIRSYLQCIKVCVDKQESAKSARSVPTQQQSQGNNAPAPSSAIGSILQYGFSLFNRSSASPSPSQQEGSSPSGPASASGSSTGSRSATPADNDNSAPARLRSLELIDSDSIGLPFPPSVTAWKTGATAAANDGSDSVYVDRPSYSIQPSPPQAAPPATSAPISINPTGPPSHTGANASVFAASAATIGSLGSSGGFNAASPGASSSFGTATAASPPVGFSAAPVNLGPAVKKRGPTSVASGLDEAGSSAFTRGGVSSMPSRVVGSGDVAQSAQFSLHGSGDASAFGPPEIPYSEIQFGKVIGSGSFGQVFSAIVRGSRVAVKVPHKQNLDATELASLQRELMLMRKVFHPNLVLYLGGCVAPKPGERFALVMQFVASDLEHVLAKDRQFLEGGQRGSVLTIERRLKLLRDAAKGLAWLHAEHIEHHDLKPGNFLVDESFTLRIADFGFAELRRGAAGKQSEFIQGTPIFMAPEVLALTYDTTKYLPQEPFKGDIYAMGLITWSVMTSIKVFDELEKTQDFNVLVNAVVENDVRPPLHHGSSSSNSMFTKTSPSALPTWAPAIPDFVARLMVRCWSPMATVRPTATELLNELSLCLPRANLPDQETAEFWQALLQDPEQFSFVDWLKFVTTLVQETGVPARDVELLKPHLSEVETILDKTVRRISIATMKKAVQSFGHFFSETERLRMMIDTLAAPWWFGSIDRTETDRLLGADSPPGVFLVRWRDLDARYPDSPFVVANVSEDASIGRQQRVVTYKPIADAVPMLELKVAGASRFYSSFFDMIDDPDTCLRVVAREATKNDAPDPYNDDMS